MKKLFSCFAVICLALNASAQYQVGNSDFETAWSNTNEPGNGWYSFVSGTGDKASLGIPFSKGNTTKVTGRGGTGSAVQLKSSSIFGQKANGNLTTGRINLGSTTPDDASNYNFTDRSEKTNNCVFSGRPDKIEFYATFKRGGTNNNGRCHALIHGDYNYKDPYESDENKSNYLIAEAVVYATPCTTWTKFEGEFTYTGKEADKSYLLATFTTNETPGGSNGDVFVIDDIKFIYNHNLASVSYDGTNVAVAQAMDLSNQLYDESKLTLTHNAKGNAQISKSYDPATGLLTITVYGEDYGKESDEDYASMYKNKDSYTTYTIQFLKKGDVNGDKSVTIADVTALVNIILGKSQAPASGVANVNGDDGGVTIADVTALVNIILGKNKE